MRQQGTFPFSANFEPQIEGEFDARKMVDSYDDLLTFTSSNYIKNGFTVNVFDADESKRGVYMCVDKDDLANPASWMKIGADINTSSDTDILSVTSSTSSLISNSRDYDITKNAATHSLFRFAGANIIQNPNYPTSQVIGWNGLTSQNGNLSVKIEFIADSSNLQFYGLGYGGTCEVWADDTFVTKLTMPTDGNFHYFKIAFKTRKIREITVYNTLAFGKVSVEQSGSIYHTKKLPRPKAIILGDSFTEYPFGYVYYLAILMNWDTWNSGSGSTGWVSDGSFNGTTGRVNFPTRLQTDVINQYPDIIMINGGLNDPYTTQAEKDAFTANMQYCITQIRTQLPNTQLYITGAFYPNGNPSQGYIDMRNEQKSICNANNVPYLDNSTWLTGNTGDSTTGNSFYYTGPDGTHPSMPLGARYLAERMADTINRLTPTITQFKPLDGNYGIGTSSPKAKLHVIADNGQLALVAQANNSGNISHFKDQDGYTIIDLSNDGGGKFYAGSPNGASGFEGGSKYDAAFLRLKRSANTLSRPIMIAYITNDDDTWYAGMKGESRKYTIAWGVAADNNTAKLEVDIDGNTYANSFVKDGGTNAQVLLADGTTATNVISGSVSTNVTAVTTFVVIIPEQENEDYQVTVQGRNALSVGGYVTNQTTTSFDYVIPAPVTGSVDFHWVLKPH